jgi:hypothetical protein
MGRTGSSVRIRRHPAEPQRSLYTGGLLGCNLSAPSKCPGLCALARPFLTSPLTARVATKTSPERPWCAAGYGIAADRCAK